MPTMTPFDGSLLSTILVGCGVALSLYLFQKFSYSQKRSPLPPGPWSFPFIGNIRCLISSPNWITYTEWYRKYDSDIVYVNIAGRPIVILNTLEAATELLEQRSRTYSSRPPFPMLSDLMGYQWAFVIMPYGPEWKASRKLVATMFNPNDKDQHQPQELKAARNFLLWLHETPEQYSILLRKMAGSAILSIAYGFNANIGQNHVYTDNAERAMDGFIAAAVPGSFLVDCFPWLRYIPTWIPGASFQRQARIWKAEMEKLLHGPFDLCKNSMIEGGVAPCFVTRCLSQLSSHSNSKADMNQERLVKQTAGTMYLGGTDTTVTALLTFFLAMVKYPEYQKKAQNELDRVVGSDRLPDFDDKDNLPYIQAILNEVLRWQPVAPLAIAHLSPDSEDTFKGYRIPPNSTVLANVWAMFHDEARFVDPYAFNPDRYITEDGQLNLNILNLTAGFGFGRRICPGMHMALSSLWITIASVLAVYNISNALDDNGQMIVPTGDYDLMNLQNRPYPFNCSIHLRSPGRLDVIRTGAEFVDGRWLISD